MILFEIGDDFVDLDAEITKVRIWPYVNWWFLMTFNRHIGRCSSPAGWIHLNEPEITTVFGSIAEHLSASVLRMRHDLILN